MPACDQRAGELAGVQRREIEALDSDATVGERRRQVIDHLERAVVHAHERQTDDVLRLAARPVAVGLDDEGRVVVHRPVARSDQLDRVLRDLVDVLQHLAAERHHDLGVVALGAVVHLVLVGEHIAGGVVRAEEVAAEEDLVLLQPRAHRLGPVHPRGEEERERLVAEAQGVAVGHHLEARVVHVQVVDQHGPCLLVAHHRQIGEALEQQRRAARVILLDVVDHEVVRSRKVVELRQQRGALRRVDRVDEHALLAAGDEVGVVAGAVGQRYELIEQAAVPVDGADEIHVLADGAWLHGHLGRFVRAGGRPVWDAPSEYIHALGRLLRGCSRTPPEVGQSVGGEKGCVQRRPHNALVMDTLRIETSIRKKGRAADPRRARGRWRPREGAL